MRIFIFTLIYIHIVYHIYVLIGVDVSRHVQSSYATQSRLTVVGWGSYLMEFCVSISSEIINLSIISRGLITKHPSKFSLIFSHPMMLDSVPNLPPQRESTSNTWSDSPPRRCKQHKGEQQFAVKGWCVSLTHLPHGTEMPTLLYTINIQRCECILRLLAAAGDNGDCFLMDTRQSKAGPREIVGTSMPRGK